MEEFIERLIQQATESYSTRMERAALRRGLGDAAAILDAAHSRLSAGRTNRETRAVCSALEAAADKIWEMRGRIAVPHTDEGGQ